MMRSLANTSVQIRCDGNQRSYNAKPDQRSGPGRSSRRLLLLATVPSLALLAQPSISLAASLAVNKEVDNDTSPLIQQLLKNTREKADERYKERLQDYYKRNFKDYFDFQAGNMQGLSPETQSDILKWIDENTDKKPYEKTSQE